MCIKCIAKNVYARPPAKGTLEARLAALLFLAATPNLSCALDLSPAAVDELFGNLVYGEYMDKNGFHPLAIGAIH
jgi:hypothetical protein